MNCVRVVDMPGADPSDGRIVCNPQGRFDSKELCKEFQFTYAFNSFDKAAENYTSQQLVYATIGLPVLNEAMSGYNCCLFAYGQTGSGKSYSVIGGPGDEGIVPLVVREIFTPRSPLSFYTLHKLFPHASHTFCFTGPRDL